MRKKGQAVRWVSEKTLAPFFIVTGLKVESIECGGRKVKVRRVRWADIWIVDIFL